MDNFYQAVLTRLLARKILDPQMALLVVCGGDHDRAVLAQCGFRHAVISNLDVRQDPAALRPFEWSFQDAEQLQFAADTFDFALVHQGLHHCYSPHRALGEMYRVSRRGLVLFEPYDNWTTRLGIRLKIGQDYEHAAVFGNQCAYGGVRNTNLPNFIYRWTEREIIKTVNCLAPQGRHRYDFIHQMRPPWDQLKSRKNKLFYHAVRLGLPLIWALGWVLPKQCNNFAAVVVKPRLPQDLHPWLRWEQGSIQPDPVWLNRRYCPPATHHG